MHTDLIHKLVIIISTVVSLIFFVIKLLSGTELVYAAYYSALIMFAVSIILLVTMQTIAQILFKHLAEQQREAIEHEMEDVIDIDSDVENDNETSPNGGRE